MTDRPVVPLPPPVELTVDQSREQYLDVCAVEAVHLSVLVIQPRTCRYACL